MVDVGDRQSAMTALSEAFDLFAAHGAHFYLRNVERELHRADAPADARDSLTKAEHRVALLVSEGYTNQSVALALGVSVHTVNTHLRAVFRKFGGVRSRVQLANAMRPHE